MADFIIPDWPVPARVRALQTLRNGGCSPGPWQSFNLGGHVGDDPICVAANRAMLSEHLPCEPLWLEQVHGTIAVDAKHSQQSVKADASYTRHPGVVCAIVTADCLPVLLCDCAGSVVAAAHAGWRGLLAGVLENTLAAMRAPPAELLAWLGPAIGATCFEVGDEVRSAFIAAHPEAVTAFRPGRTGKWLADIYLLARQRLLRAGVANVFGGNACTVCEPEHYFSYRRDGITGRQATLIWLAGDSV